MHWPGWSSAMSPATCSSCSSPSTPVLRLRVRGHAPFGESFTRCGRLDWPGEHASERAARTAASAPRAAHADRRTAGRAEHDCASRSARPDVHTGGEQDQQPGDREPDRRHPLVLCAHPARHRRFHGRAGGDRHRLHGPQADQGDGRAGNGPGHGGDGHRDHPPRLAGARDPVPDLLDLRDGRDAFRPLPLRH